MFTPKHGSVDWSPDNSLKSLQHLRQLITLKQTEKFFIFAVITERVIEGPRERERKVRRGVGGSTEESWNEKAFFAKRWAEPDTKSSASPQPLTPHGIWQACALACHCPCIKPSNTTCQFFAICVKKKKGKKKRNPPDDGNDSSHLITQSEVWLLTSLIGGLLLNITLNNKRGIKRRGGGRGLLCLSVKNKPTLCCQQKTPQITC